MIGILSRSLQRYRYRKYTRHLSLNLWQRLLRLLLILFGLIAVNSSVLCAFESMGAADAIWMSLTTITTVGYGDLSPATLVGRISTVLTMFAWGIALVGMIASEFIDWRLLKTQKLLSGDWVMQDMQDHIQIFGTPKHNPVTFLKGMVDEIKQIPDFKHCPIQILTRSYPEGLPVELQSLKVLHQTGDAEDIEKIKAVNPGHARIIVILAKDFSDPRSDSFTFDLLTKLQDLNVSTFIVAEAVRPENKIRFLKAGANVVIRPDRVYPEKTVRVMTAPAAGEALDELTDFGGDHLAQLDIKFSNLTFSAISTALSQAGAGIAVGYKKTDGAIEINPPQDISLSGDCLLAIVHEDQLDKAHQTFTDLAAQ
jgi:voltage-gated potassium channel|tara:strand:+ start:2723 stop:3826 length:1104 start_codon:yes stop_codon:yes gene_type:complete